jgi:hypothetical protein
MSLANKVLACKGLSPDGPLFHVRHNICFGVKFHAGTEDDLPTPPMEMWDKQYLRLPYPLTVLEFTVAGKNWLLAMSQQPDQENIDCAVLSDLHGSWGYACSFEITPNGVGRSGGWQHHGFIADGNDDAKRILMGGCANAVLAFLLALKCSNVRQKVISPSKLKTKIAVDSGRWPPFEYRVLEIKPGRACKKPNNGGTTHASPRLHWRRGHIRRLPSGDLTWVQPCMVGDKEAGEIKKDYRVKKRAAC